MAFIDKKLNGRYQVRWTDPDGQERARTVPDMATAKRVKLDVERTVSEGHRWDPRDAVALPEVPEVLKKYIENRGKRLKPRTLHRYGENLDLLLRFLRSERPRGSFPVSMLSKPTLEDFHTSLLQSENGLHGRQRGPDTARKIVEVAQLAWEWADDSGRWDGLIPRPRRIEMQRSEPEPVVAPEWAEMDRAIDAARGWLKLLMTFLRYTGLRVGETMLLRWSDIDLERGHLTIRGEISKTRRGRVIPLSAHLLGVLATWDQTGDFVIASGRRAGERERQARPRDADRAWARGRPRGGVVGRAVPRVPQRLQDGAPGARRARGRDRLPAGPQARTREPRSLHRPLARAAPRRCRWADSCGGSRPEDRSVAPRGIGPFRDHAVIWELPPWPTRR